jgi:hypothetical protein
VGLITVGLAGGGEAFGEAARVGQSQVVWHLGQVMWIVSETAGTAIFTEHFGHNNSMVLFISVGARVPVS